MEITLDTPQGKYQINSYELGKITINHLIYNQSLIVSPTELIFPWQPQSFDQLKTEHFSFIAEKKPQVVLLGTGEQLQFPHPSILAPLINKQIGVEVMTTAAACRTFNVLAAEERKVIAALLI